jgi:hypothetical protein
MASSKWVLIGANQRRAIIQPGFKHSFQVRMRACLKSRPNLICATAEGSQNSRNPCRYNNLAHPGKLRKGLHTGGDEPGEMKKKIIIFLVWNNF